MSQCTAAPRPLEALVADPDEDTRRLCRAILQEQGYQVVEASHAEDLVSQVRGRAPDIVIVDAHLAGTSGSNSLDSLRGLMSHPHVPVIVLSEMRHAAEVVGRLDSTIHEYLGKPVRPQELLARLDGLTSRVAASRELQLKRDQLGEHSRVLMLLLEFSSTLATAECLEDIVSDTLTVAAAIFSCQRACILMPDPENRVLTVTGSIGMGRTLVDALIVPVGEGVAGRVYESGGRILVSHHQPVAQASVHDCGLYTKPPALAIAMRASSHVVGVLYLAERLAQGLFNECELDYVSLISNSSAAAIHNVLSRQDREDAQNALTVALASLAEHRDQETGQHLDRMTGFCMILAEELRDHSPYGSQIDATFLENLSRAAPLHDIGKVGIPDYVLQKPEKLTHEELEIMRQHPVIGADTIRTARARSPHSPFLKMAEEITQNHHEWFNGNGYPCGVREAQIPLSARIAALADVYDALTSRRVYKQAICHDRAQNMIAELAGRQFDPVVVQAFLDSAERFKTLATELSEDLTVDEVALTASMTLK